MLGFIAEHAERADDAIRQRLEADRRRRSSASCWCWRTRAARNSSASRRSHLKDFMQVDRDGRGIINILAADKLMENPRLYATFLLWLLSELFEELPEVGDPRQAEARVLLRRGASAVQRRAEGAAGQDRAGGAADPLQGRRRLFRHAEPARRARQGAGAARQPRAARAARLHAARPEGGARRRRDLPRQSEARHRDRSSPSSARARRWSRSWKATARPRWSSAAWCARRRRALGPVTPDERKAVIGEKPDEGQIRSGRSTRNPPTRCWRSARTKPQRRASGQRRCAGSEGAPQQGGVLGEIGGMLGSIFGTNRPRGQRLSTGQLITREITRSVTNTVAGQIAGSIGKSIGGSMGSSVGRAIVRGTLGRHFAEVEVPASPGAAEARPESMNTGVVESRCRCDTDRLVVMDSGSHAARRPE